MRPSPSVPNREPMVMEKLLVTALEAAEAAARIQIQHFRRFSVDSAREKAQSDFVTQVDLEAQAAAIATVRRAFPDHWILAEEESGGTPDRRMISDREWPKGGEYLWIIDPLDGTTNFLHGHPMFCASVAVGHLPAAEASKGRNPGLTFQGCLEAGAVVAPRTGERWWAQRGGGAWKNGQRLSVSKIESLARALIGTGFPFKEPGIVPRYADQLKRVLPNTGGIRRGGSAALDLCYLAEGLLDGFWEEDYLSPWDSAAGLLLLSESGGVASRMDGSGIDLKNGSILGGNSAALAAGLKDLLEGRE